MTTFGFVAHIALAYAAFGALIGACLGEKYCRVETAALWAVAWPLFLPLAIYVRVSGRHGDPLVTASDLTDSIE